MKFHFLTLFALAFISTHGQETDTTHFKNIVVKRSISLLAGVSFGKKTFFELGISRNNNSVVGHHPLSTVYFYSTEIKFGDRTFIGPKIGGWLAGGAGGIAMGANTIYYTDFENGSLVFRPEIGFGFENFKLVYGYNAILTKFHLSGLNRHLVNIAYCFKIKKLKDKLRKR